VTNTGPHNPRDLCSDEQKRTAHEVPADFLWSPSTLDLARLVREVAEVLRPMMSEADVFTITVEPGHLSITGRGEVKVPGRDTWYGASDDGVLQWTAATVAGVRVDRCRPVDVEGGS